MFAYVRLFETKAEACIHDAGCVQVREVTAMHLVKTLSILDNRTTPLGSRRAASTGCTILGN